jgi:hypothetical protein
MGRWENGNGDDNGMWYKWGLGALTIAAVLLFLLWFWNGGSHQ